MEQILLNISPAIPIHNLIRLVLGRNEMFAVVCTELLHSCLFFYSYDSSIYLKGFSLITSHLIRTPNQQSRNQRERSAQIWLYLISRSTASQDQWWFWHGRSLFESTRALLVSTTVFIFEPGSKLSDASIGHHQRFG